MLSVVGGSIRYLPNPKTGVSKEVYLNVSCLRCVDTKLAQKTTGNNAVQIDTKPVV